MLRRFQSQGLGTTAPESNDVYTLENRTRPNLQSRSGRWHANTISASLTKPNERRLRSIWANMRRLKSEGDGYVAEL